MSPISCARGSSSCCGRRGRHTRTSSNGKNSPWRRHRSSLAVGTPRTRPSSCSEHRPCWRREGRGLIPSQTGHSLFVEQTSVLHTVSTSVRWDAHFSSENVTRASPESPKPPACIEHISVLDRLSQLYLHDEGLSRVRIPHSLGEIHILTGKMGRALLQ